MSHESSSQGFDTKNLGTKKHLFHYISLRFSFQQRKASLFFFDAHSEVIASHLKILIQLKKNKKQFTHQNNRYKSAIKPSEQINGTRRASGT